MNPIDRQAMFGKTPEIFDNIDNSAGAGGGRHLGSAAWIKAVSTCDQLSDKAAEIAKDPMLGEKGRQQKLARVVLDCEIEIAKVGAWTAQLRDEAAAAKAGFKSSVPNDNSINATLWPMLPKEPLGTQTKYHDALAKRDFMTCNAIENMPSVYEGALDQETLRKLKMERIFAENPEAAKAISVAEQTFNAVESAYNSADQFVDEIAKDLPAPDDGDNIRVGADGLRILSPSQIKEGMDGAA